MIALLVSSVPIIGTLVAFGTVWKCYWICAAEKRLPAKLIFPAISALGTQPPEQKWYQVGFGAAGCFVALTVLLVHHYIAPHLLVGREGDKLQAGQTMVSSMLSSGLVMAAGTAVQGIFTLETTLSMQCCVHWVGAMAFMWGAMSHGNTAADLYEASATQYRSELLMTPTLATSLKFKRLLLGAPMFMFVLPLLLQMFSREDASTDTSVQGMVSKVSVPPLAVGQIQATSSRELKARLTARHVQFGGAVEKSDFEALYKQDLLAFPDKEEFVLKPVQEAQQQPVSAQAGAQDNNQLGMQGTPAENAMGLMQWLIIGVFVLYLASYGVDLYAALTSSPPTALPNKND